MAYVIGGVLAAGAGLRMGRPKATLLVDGQRLVDRAVKAMTAGGCDQVMAVVGDGVTVDDALAVVNPAPERGMRSSLALVLDAAIGIGSAVRSAAPGTDVGLAVMLVDTPGIDAAAVRAVVDHWREQPARIAVGRFGGGRAPSHRGHPTVMGLADWQAALLVAGPDEGARRYLNAHRDRVDEIPVAGDPADLDRPEDLAAWLENR